MIELYPPATEGPEALLVLRPRRALRGRQLVGVFLVLSGSVWLIALFSWVQGNAFAPAFALLDTLVVGLALRWAWCLGERYEVVALDARAVEVRRSGEAATAFRAHPYWVRLSVAGERGEPRVRLGAQGRRVEIGSFLGPEERRRLAERLKGLLAAAAGRGRVGQDTSGVNR